MRKLPFLALAAALFAGCDANNEEVALDGTWRVVSYRLGVDPNEGNVAYAYVQGTSAVLYDFEADEYGNGRECYSVREGTLQHEGGDRYQLTYGSGISLNFEVELDGERLVLSKGPLLNASFERSDKQPSEFTPLC